MGAVSRAVDQYKNYPGKIEDYEPGHSSIAQIDNRVSFSKLLLYKSYENDNWIFSKKLKAL